jgi:hypothetical protein
LTDNHSTEIWARYVHARGRPKKSFFHVTRASCLPDIAVSGGLLSRRQRTDGGPQHNWGANEDLGIDYVCCSLLPSWGMLTSRMAGEETVILIVDAERAAQQEDLKLVPGNSGSSQARPYIGGIVDTDEVIKATLAREQHSEVLVRDEIPLALVPIVMFCDATARDTWWPVVERSLAQAGRGWGPRVLIDGDLNGVRFPPGHEIIDRARPITDGVNRRRADLLRSGVIPSGLTIEEVEWDLEEDEEDTFDEDSDLWDALYGNRRHLTDYADFDDWPYEV